MGGGVSSIYATGAIERTLSVDQEAGKTYLSSGSCEQAVVIDQGEV